MWIRIFIQQYNLGDKLTKDLSDIVEVSIAVWCLINTIYKSDENKLSTDNNNTLI